MARGDSRNVPRISLRTQLLLGACLWTLGLFALAVSISTALMLRYPAYPRFLHSTRLDHNVAMIGGALLALAVGLWMFRNAMAPFDDLRERLAAVRDGRSRRLDGDYAAEVEPLVSDLNALLDDREQRVAKALAKAADFAHGLKTPLAVVAQEAERAAAQGHGEMGDTIAQQVERMRRQVDYHVAHARAAASGGNPNARASVAQSVDGLARTLHRLHGERGVRISATVAADHAFRGQREDLDEMLGNLLDNACKWARSRVTVASARDDGRIVVTVDDDGAGLPAALRDAVLHRGVRADQAAPGSGLGLAIVRDLAEVYGGSIALVDSPHGGLRATLSLPAADNSERLTPG
jgi:signal transduction histidine kinase